MKIELKELNVSGRAQQELEPVETIYQKSLRELEEQYRKEVISEQKPNTIIYYDVRD